MSPDLRALPPTFTATVDSLHRVAEQIVSPARKPESAISLQATPGGFGTPPFPFADGEHQVLVDGTQLVHRTGADERRAGLTSLAAAGEIVRDLLPAGVVLTDDALEVDIEAARVLADWYALGSEVLTRLIARAGPEGAPSPVKLFPEHFDIAIELGSEAAGTRANYGLSPGDEEHDEPYAYVGPWSAEVSGELWTATGFTGAELAYGELLAAPDPDAAALEFFTTRAEALARTGRSSA